MYKLPTIMVAALALFSRANAGTITSTDYEDAQCTARTTECGPDNVNMAANGDCAEADVTNKPPDSIEWQSGVCLPPCTGDCSWPFISANDDIGLMLASQGVNAQYTKITCANGATTVEHFSDATCTNKVSGDALDAALTAGFNQMMNASMAGSGMQGMLDCMNFDFNLMSGVSISGTHCDVVMTTSGDEVRHAFTAARACESDVRTF